MGWRPTSGSLSISLHGRTIRPAHGYLDADIRRARQLCNRTAIGRVDGSGDAGVGRIGGRLWKFRRTIQSRGRRLGKYVGDQRAVGTLRAFGVVDGEGNAGVGRRG